MMGRFRVLEVFARFIALLILGSMLSSPSFSAEEPLRIAFRVVCDDEAASKELSAALQKRLEKSPYTLSNSYPARKLFVYAQRDVNDRKNPDGWSFAIAHVTNQITYFAASKLLPLEGAGIDDARPALAQMLREEGFLSHLNVAHVDEWSTETIDRVADQVVEDFLKKLPK